MTVQKTGLRHWFAKDGVNHPFINLAVGAAAGLALVFGVGDFDTASNTRKQVVAAHTEGRLEAPSQACAKTILANTEVMTKFSAANSWERDDVIIKAFKDSGQPIESDVADKCVTLVAAGPSEKKT